MIIAAVAFISICALVCAGAYLLFGAGGVVALALANAAFVVGVCLGRRLGIDEALEHVQEQLVDETKRAIEEKLRSRVPCNCEADTVAGRITAKK